MRMSLALISFCAVRVWGAAVPLSQASQQPFSFSDGNEVLNAHVDSAILDILKEFKTPGGVGVAVVRKTDEGIWKLESKGYGNATADGAKVTAETRFAIGSNSKLFDVFATGLLISNETLAPRISWTSKIASILPSWKLMDPVATRESTIVDLMSHRTGLPRHDFMEACDESAEDVISRLQYLRPSTGFREQLQYNNHMYTVLSSLPKALLNVTYEAYVHDNIFAPLGMDATTYLYADAAATGKLADSFLRQDANQSEDPFGQGTVRTLPYWDQSKSGHVVSGAGGVISTAHDMAIWLQTLLLEGITESNKTVIPPAVIRKAATGVTVYTPVATYPELSPIVYGGGQMRGTYRGFEMIEHGGATQGFRSQVTRFPSENFGIAVMSNEEDLGTQIMESVKYRIIDEVFQLEPIDWVARYRSKIADAVPPPPQRRRKNPEPPSVPYTVLAETYHNAGYRGLHFCLFSANVTTTDDACAALAKEVTEFPPDVVDPNVPTLISKWETIVPTNYMQLAHYSGNTFNLTGLKSNPTADSVWVRKVPGLAAEFEIRGEEIGFAISGIWGPGDGIEAPEGSTVRERAEVWFSKN